MATIRIPVPRPRGEDVTPFLSPQAVDIHVNLICGQLAARLNLFLDGYEEARTQTPYQLYSHADSFPRIIREELRFAAGGMAAHEAFFDCLVTEGGQLPEAVSAEALRHSFGSTDSFFYIFREEAQRMKNGGFLWLCVEKRARHRFLRLIPLPGYELPVPLIPVFALDLWEHAYLNTYGCDRRAYADAFLRQLDWRKIGERIGG